MSNRPSLRMTRPLLAGLIVSLLVGWLLAWAAARWVGPESQTWQAPEVRADDTIAEPPLAARIAPRTEALTFARFRQSGQLRLLLVSRLEADRAYGWDLSARWPALPADPLTVFRTLGFAALQAVDGPELEVPHGQLVQPFEGKAVQVATGINYPEHGREVAVDESFLFPKLTRPAHFMAPVGTHGGLLDYELELGFVTLAPLKADTVPRNIGLVLASDYTDREALLRGIDLNHLASGRGFTAAKSRPDFMPVGNLLVVPVDPDTFVRSLTLRLWVNGQLRQTAEPRRLIWDWRRIFTETFRRRSLTWSVDGRTVALPVGEGTVAAGTLFLSGTPEGVIFRAPTARQKFLGFTERVFTLRWNDPQALVEPLLRESRRARLYLQPGDRIVMQADGLGFIVNTVVDGAAPAPTPASP